MPSILVHPTTSKGAIAFCDLCIEANRFRDLSPDIEALSLNPEHPYSAGDKLLLEDDDL